MKRTTLKPLTQGQLKRLVDYLDDIERQMQIPVYISNKSRVISKRHRQNVLRLSRNRLHALAVVKHFVLSNIYDSGVNINDRPNFRVNNIYDPKSDG